MLSLLPERLDRMLLLGAHCDDIAIGAGGALLELCRAHPGVTVTALVLTGGGSLREEEERAAPKRFRPTEDVGLNCALETFFGFPAISFR